jgi:hypothetical protein
MKTRHVIDTKNNEVYEINEYPLLSLYTGRDSKGDWRIFNKQYIDSLIDENMREAHTFFVNNCQSIGIVITFKKKKHGKSKD